MTNDRRDRTFPNHAVWLEILRIVSAEEEAEAIKDLPSIEAWRFCECFYDIPELS